VEDNLELGAYLHYKMLGGGKAEVKKTSEMVYALFPILKERRKATCRNVIGAVNSKCSP